MLQPTNNKNILLQNVVSVSVAAPRGMGGNVVSSRKRTWGRALEADTACTEKKLQKFMQKAVARSFFFLLMNY